MTTYRIDLERTEYVAETYIVIATSGKEAITKAIEKQGNRLSVIHTRNPVCHVLSVIDLEGDEDGA